MAWEKLSQMSIRSGEIPSPRQTSIDKTNDCAMKSERGALVRGSDPPSGQCYKTTGETWRAPARCIWALLCRKEVTKFLDPSPMETNRPSFWFGKRAYDTAGSRALHHGSTWYLRGRHLHPPALPNTNRVGRGLILCRDRRPIVAWAVFFISVFTIFNVKAQIPPRTAAWTNNPLKKKIIPFSPQRRYESIFSRFIFWVIWKENLATSRFHCHRSNVRGVR